MSSVRRMVACMLLSLMLFHLVDSDQTSAYSDVRRFDVNLDDPPIERWTQLAKHFPGLGEKMIAILREVIGSTWKEKILLALAEDYHSFMPQPYKDEITGISEAMNISTGYVVCMNLFYSATANRRHNQKMCTSIVVTDKHGSVYHARNLDFNFQKTLHGGTMTVDFKRNGSIVYTMTGFFGQIGFFTVLKPKAFTISLNERHTGEWWMMVLEILKDREHANIPSLLIRDIVDQETSYDAVVARLSSAHQLAPSYYIVGGLRAGEGAVVTHGRWTTPDVYHLNQTQEKWFLVETNYDHWTTPPPGDDRRDPAIREIMKIGQGNISLDALHKVLSVHPVLNNQTIYTALMSAGNPGAYAAYFN